VSESSFDVFFYKGISTEGENRMDFIERLFGMSPDGGSGLTEASYVFLAALVILLLFLRKSWRSTAKTERSS
jgi:hypothetical protein